MVKEFSAGAKVKSFFHNACLVEVTIVPFPPLQLFRWYSEKVT